MNDKYHATVVESTKLIHNMPTKNNWTTLGDGISINRLASAFASPLLLLVRLIGDSDSDIFSRENEGEMKRGLKIRTPHTQSDAMM